MEGTKPRTASSIGMFDMPMELTVLGLVPSMKRVLPCAVRKHVTNRRIQ